MVIADQMRELSEAIAESNDRISQLVSTLTPLLRDVKSSVRSLQGRTSEFTVQYEQHRDGIQSMSRQLQDATAETIATGDKTLAEIIGRSGDSLVALQTQDIISQRLRKLLTLTSRHSEDEGLASDLAKIDAPGYLSDDLPPSEESMNAGEMELF